MMRDQELHLSDEDLLLAADGELPKAEMERVSAHLASCWTCRARVRDIENAIADFILVRNESTPKLPPADGPRALLRLRIAQLYQSGLTPWAGMSTVLRTRAAGLAWSVTLGLLIGCVLWRVIQPAPEKHLHPADLRTRSVPDPRLTPGATLPLTREDVCAAGLVETAHVVPVDVANRVFAAYGVAAKPRAYEVDFLITPALGGSDSVRNFWPQPYRNTVWNAHIKDALEDRLQELVCAGQLELGTAQREIAVDWISAYKKYFHTEVPLPQHASFLRDRPWE
jgi:hypothetical protein